MKALSFYQKNTVIPTYLLIILKIVTIIAINLCRHLTCMEFIINNKDSKGIHNMDMDMGIRNSKAWT